MNSDDIWINTYINIYFYSASDARQTLVSVKYTINYIPFYTRKNSMLGKVRGLLRMKTLVVFLASSVVCGFVVVRKDWFFWTLFFILFFMSHIVRHSTYIDYSKNFNSISPPKDEMIDGALGKKIFRKKIKKKSLK